MAENVANIYILNRATYNDRVDRGEIQTYDMYFVREPMFENSKLLSLYVGLAKQCDVLDITKDAESWDTPIDFVNLSNNYNIPAQYQIPNKLLFYKQDGYSEVQAGQTIQFTEDQYRLVMWYPEEGKFLECGLPKTTIICPEDLPSVQHGVLNNVYFRTKENYKSIYVFDGTSFVKVFDDNDYIKEGSLLAPDNITILEDSNHVISGVGANVAGKTFTIGGQDTVAGSGATIYNDYTTNKTAGAYSNVFGQNNTSKSSYSTIFGKGNSDNSTSANDASNLLIGINNTVNGNSVQNSVFGYNNTLNVASGTGNLINGSNNNISGSNINYNLIYGSSNITGLTTIEHSIVGGMSNTINGTACTQSVIIGTNNQMVVQGSSYGNIIIGGYITSTLNSNRGCLVVGQGLVFSPEQQTDGRVLLGKYNDSTVTDSVFTIGNGTESLRSDCIRLSSLGVLQLCGANGNVVTKNGDTVESTREVLTGITADGESYTSAYLPKNSQELLLSTTHTVSSITITDISQMFYDNGRGISTKSVSDGYNSVIIFKKDSSVTSVENLLTNFTATDNTKIYLLNKDLDISTYDVIHVMLFNDGFHICAIVAGYEE
jgi:hypothetical protein